MPITVPGIDLGKNGCSVVGLDAAGRVMPRRRLCHAPGGLEAHRRAAGLHDGEEACCGARIISSGARRARRVTQGHEVRPMAPEYVRPHVKAHGNDGRDAEAIAEAATRPTMRSVELKDEARLGVQTPHRVRSRPAAEIPVRRGPVGGPAAPVGVEDLRPAVARQRLPARAEAERHVDRVRRPPGRDRPARPAHRRDEVEEAAPKPRRSRAEAAPEPRRSRAASGWG